MSLLYQTKGIVLSKRDHKEVDRWYSVYTPDKGKVEFLARGGHKPLAKLTPHLEMVAEVELLLVYGRYYQTVAGVDRRRAFSGLYGDLTKLTLAHNALHLLDIGTKPHEADIGLYELLTGWLDFLEKAPELTQSRSSFLLGVFTLKLIALIGYRPELVHCLSCRKKLEQEQFRWHAIRGGVVCHNCVQIDQEQWFSARQLSGSALKLLRHGISESFENQLRIHLSGADLLAFHEAVESLIIAHFPTIPASSLRASCSVC